MKHEIWNPGSVKHTVKIVYIQKVSLLCFIREWIHWPHPIPFPFPSSYRFLASIFSQLNFFLSTFFSQLFSFNFFQRIICPPCTLAALTSIITSAANFNSECFTQISGSLNTLMLQLVVTESKCNEWLNSFQKIGFLSCEHFLENFSSECHQNS